MDFDLFRKKAWNLCRISSRTPKCFGFPVNVRVSSGLNKNDRGQHTGLSTVQYSILTQGLKLIANVCYMHVQLGLYVFSNTLQNKQVKNVCKNIESKFIVWYHGRDELSPLPFLKAFFFVHVHVGSNEINCTWKLDGRECSYSRHVVDKQEECIDMGKTTHNK